jgi:hypothetical protein
MEKLAKKLHGENSKQAIKKTYGLLVNQSTAYLLPLTFYFLPITLATHFAPNTTIFPPGHY